MIIKVPCNYCKDGLRIHCKCTLCHKEFIIKVEDSFPDDCPNCFNYGLFEEVKNNKTIIEQVYVIGNKECTQFLDDELDYVNSIIYAHLYHLRSDAETDMNYHLSETIWKYLYQVTITYEIKGE